MRKILFLFVLLSQIAFAQPKQMSLEDAVYGRYTYLSPASLSGLAWRNDERFTQIKEKICVCEWQAASIQKTIWQRL